MFPGDTSMGGTARRFPDTTSGLLSQLGSCDEGLYRNGLDLISSRYWKPVYSYLRIAFGQPNEDAKDMTQGFFLMLTSRETLRGYDRRRSSFRSFLKTLLTRYTSDHRRSRNRLKRGGTATTLSLDADYDPTTPSSVDAAAADPAETLDREWARSLVENAIGRVQRKYREENRGVRMRILEEYLLPEAEPKRTYAEFGSTLGITESDVHNNLTAIRTDLRHEIRNQLRDITSSEQELEEEWNALFNNIP